MPFSAINVIINAVFCAGEPEGRDPEVDVEPAVRKASLGPPPGFAHRTVIKSPVSHTPHASCDADNSGDIHDNESTSGFIHKARSQSPVTGPPPGLTSISQLDCEANDGKWSPRASAQRSSNNSPCNHRSPQAYGFSHDKGGHPAQSHQGSQPNSEISLGRPPRWGDIESDQERDCNDGWASDESAGHPNFDDHHSGRQCIDEYSELKASDVRADDFNDKASLGWSVDDEGCHVDSLDTHFSDPALTRQNSTRSVQPDIDVRVAGPMRSQSDSCPSSYGEATPPGFGNAPVDFHDDNMFPSAKGLGRYVLLLVLTFPT